MKNLNIKLPFLLSFLFSFDLIRPFGYSLSAEFLFLGVIFISLNEDFLPALIFSAVFGLLCDFFSPGIKPLRAVELPFICFLNHYFISLFSFVNKKKQVLIIKNFLVLLALLIHIVFNSFYTGLILPLFWIKFLIQSILIYFFMACFLDSDSIIVRKEIISGFVSAMTRKT